MTRNRIVLMVLFSIVFAQLDVLGARLEKATAKFTIDVNGTISFPDSSAWILTKIAGVKPKKMTIGSKSFIIINKKEQKLSGYTSCNFINGKVDFKDSSSITITGIPPVKRSCDKVTDKMELLFIDKLHKTTSWKIVGNILYFYENGTVILEFIEVPRVENK